LLESYVAVISLINTLLIAVVGVMGYRLNARANDAAKRESEILDIVRRELISGTLSDVLDLKLKPIVQRLDELTVKIDEYHKRDAKDEQ
jgi:nucleoside permease NupC